MDQLDMAQELDARFRHKALEVQARARANGQRPTRMSCTDCAAPIPTARQTAVPGCQRCISCANTFEKGR